MRCAFCELIICAIIYKLRRCRTDLVHGLVRKLDPTFYEVNFIFPYFGPFSKIGTSSWLTALPLDEQGFYLSKQEFWDALHLRYDWKLENIPSHCVCGAMFSPDHAMICKHGGLTFIHHNDLRNITAEWLSKVCYDVAIEPPLQPLTGESIEPRSANRQDEARADIHARGFWGQRQSAFFDVRVFITHGVTANPVSHHCIGATNYRRSENMETALGR